MNISNIILAVFQLRDEMSAMQPVNLWPILIILFKSVVNTKKGGKSMIGNSKFLKLTNFSFYVLVFILFSKKPSVEIFDIFFMNFEPNFDRSQSDLIKRITL